MSADELTREDFTTYDLPTRPRQYSREYQQDLRHFLAISMFVTVVVVGVVLFGAL